MSRNSEGNTRAKLDYGYQRGTIDPGSGVSGQRCKSLAAVAPPPRRMKMVVDWYRYSPYGAPTIVAQTNGAATENPWRYLSAYYSSETGGYHHLGARMYDNSSHFTQPDPERGNLGEPLSTSGFSYSSCDPINRTDRNGRDDCAAGVVSTLFGSVSLLASGYGLFTVPLTGGLSTVAVVAGFEASIGGLIFGIDQIVDSC